MQLFFFSGSGVSTGQQLTIDGQEAIHIGRVLRHSVGDLIFCTNGLGNFYHAQIQRVSKSEILTQVREHTVIPKPVFAGLTLAVGILKNRDKMEWIVEKAVELGVGSVCFLQTHHAEREKIRIDRFQAVAISAMKQSLQCWLPTVQVQTFPELLSSSNAASRPLLLAHEKTTDTSTGEYSKLAGAPELVLCVGPEGGFSEDEIAQSIQAGAFVTSLGPNRLRTETAAIHLLGVIRHHQEIDRPSRGITLYS